MTGHQGSALLRGYRRDERQVTDRVLRELALGEEYRRHLLGVLDRWVAPSTGGAALADLPYLTCYACGGDPDQVVPIGAAWSLMRLSAKLFDDVEDAEVTIAVPQTINAALGLVMAALSTLTSLPQSLCHGREKGVIAERYTRACVTACGGQHADIAAADALGSLDPDGWLAIARAKSGAFYGWGAWVGAVVASPDDELAERLWQYGAELGVLLQLADDYDGIWCVDGVSDLVAGRPGLPVAYALTAAEPEGRARLVEGLRRARLGSLEQERAVRVELESLGAQAFMLVAGRACIGRALEALAGADLPAGRVDALSSLLTDIFPVLNYVGREGVRQ